MANQHWLESKSPISQVQRWLHGRQADGVILLILGTLIAFLLVYSLVLGKANRSSVPYTPEDIVYTQPMNIGHGNNTGAAPMAKPSVSTGLFPEASISENFYDFGAVQTPQVVERVFIITNRGLAPLIVQNAYTTCGCTLAELTSSEIPPGKAALLTVHFDTGFHDMRGATVRRGVILQTNDPAHPQQEIWVQARIN
jgi:hypothetical protein